MSISSATDARRWMGLGIGAIVVILAVTGVFLFLTLPDGNAFNDRVERIFIENDALTSGGEIRLLEILAQSGTAFSDTLTSYRVIIFVLLLFAAALLVTAVVLLVLLMLLNRRMAEVERAGIHVSSLVVSREDGVLMLNGMEFKLTDAAMETLSMLAEARLDGDILSGAELEAAISGRPVPECDEAAGAVRIKRLRDALGNQLVAGLLVKTVPRKGYTLTLDRTTIEIL